jgi:hypothetical protein
MPTTTHDPVYEVATGSLLAVLRFVDPDAQHELRLSTERLRLRYLAADVTRLRQAIDGRFDEDALKGGGLIEGEKVGFEGDPPHDPGLKSAEREIRSARILMQYAGALADIVPPQRQPPYRLISLSKASPTQVALELAPYAIVPLTVGLLGLVGRLLPVAEKLATFRARTNAINKTAELKAALAQAAIDEVHQGKVDVLAYIARQEHLALPVEIDILDPEVDGSAELVDLLNK